MLQLLKTRTKAFQFQVLMYFDQAIRRKNGISPLLGESFLCRMDNL
jgi:hypothetical protein